MPPEVRSQASFTIDEWCLRHGFSRRTYYNLKNAGKGPREMQVLGSKRISSDADREWVLAREADALTSGEAA